MRPCVQAFGSLLLTLAHRYAFPDPEEAVYLAFQDLRASCPGWTGSHLPARAWAVAVAKRRFDRLARELGVMPPRPVN